MKENIKLNIDNPQELEKLYRTDKSSFKREFNLLYPDLKENKIAEFWILHGAHAVNLHL